MREDLESLAADLVAKARAFGADEADAYVRSGVESSVKVRKGEIESLTEAGSRSVSLRVIKDKRTAVCNTSDLAPRALDELARTAVELAAISEPDEFAGLPAPEDLATGHSAALQLYDERIESLTVDEMKEMVLCAERSAFDFDPRITNSAGSELGVERGVLALVNSAGFSGSYPSTAASLSVEVMADDADGKKRNDYWYTVERLLHRLDAPEEVGRRAAARAVRKIGARKPDTREVPAVWDPLMAAQLARVIAGAASGEELFKRATFLTELEGQPVAPAHVSIVSDSTLPARLMTRPFDGEGVRTRRSPIVEQGIFRQFLFDSYYARRLGRRTTGSAVRSGDTIAIGGGNIVLEPGAQSPAEIIGSVSDGLYLTDLMGFGVNMTTGDFSRGAAGIWIENGELSYPVTEINVSGNLKEMLQRIDMVGDDLLWRGGAAAPTIRMSRLTVSGL
jgi:PmbA protein